MSEVLLFVLSLQYVKPKGLKIMNTKLKFTVEIEFSDKIVSDDDIAEIVENITTGLVEQANSIGLAPIDSDAFTCAIRVSDNHGTEHNYKFI